jgi:two-component system response regulator AlgR
MNGASLRVLLVDDEELALERLEYLCAGLHDVEVIGRATDGRDALAIIANSAPDVVLLDISMPELDGMAVARSLAGIAERPRIVFVTAHENFAVDAFALDASDYLLKPVSAARLGQAFDRVRTSRHVAPPKIPAHATEFWIPHKGAVVRVDASRIDLIEAERDYMRLHVGPRSYLLHTTIAMLEQRLDATRFLRLHRSIIVSRNRITMLERDAGGGWHARLWDGRVLRIGRTYLKRVQDTLAL